MSCYALGSAALTCHLQLHARTQSYLYLYWMQVEVWADRIVVTFIRNAPLVASRSSSKVAVVGAVAPFAFHVVTVPFPIRQ